MAHVCQPVSDAARYTLIILHDDYSHEFPPPQACRKVRRIEP
jgi:hypothetical protein